MCRPSRVEASAEVCVLQDMPDMSVNETPAFLLLEEAQKKRGRLSFTSLLVLLCLPQRSRHARARGEAQALTDGRARLRGAPARGESKDGACATGAALSVYARSACFQRRAARGRGRRRVQRVATACVSATAGACPSEPGQRVGEGGVECSVPRACRPPQVLS